MSLRYWYQLVHSHHQWQSVFTCKQFSASLRGLCFTLISNCCIVHFLYRVQQKTVGPLQKELQLLQNKNLFTRLSALNVQFYKILFTSSLLARSECRKPTGFCLVDWWCKELKSFSSMNFFASQYRKCCFHCCAFLLAHSVYASVVNMFCNYDAFIDMTMCGHFYVKTKWMNGWLV